MRRCIQLANRAGGYNAPNPRVGALIVYQNQIIGEGYHQQYGQAHAEVNAVASVAEEHRQFLSQSTIYVTLEPCFHYGKTPPCVDLILEHQIPRVVIACTDPFEKVAGQSIKKLKERGVEVVVGVLEEEATWLARRFFTNVQQKRPYVLLKFAQSKDGFIGNINEEIAISNAMSKRLVHKWRSEEAAILVGTNTALVDDPQLNNRLYFGRNPLRLVLDRQLRLPEQLHIFDGRIETWVFTAENDCPKRKGVRFITLDFDEHLIERILDYLYQQKIQSVMVEGGRQLLQSFIDAGLWDEARVFVGNKRLGDGVAAPIIPVQYLEKEQIFENNQLKTYIKKSL